MFVPNKEVKPRPPPFAKQSMLHQIRKSSHPYCHAHLELVVQTLDVVLDPLDELGLVLADGAADVRPHEERVVAREDAEHLDGVLGRAELVPQPRRDASLHPVNTLVVPGGGGETQTDYEFKKFIKGVRSDSEKF